MTLKKILFLFVLAHALSACSYVKSVIVQSQYLAQQTYAPTQRGSKHLLDRDTFFVSGKIMNGSDLNRDAVAVVALSDEHRQDEIVDVGHFARVDSFYGLNLPPGEYRLLVVSDRNRDSFYDESEVVGGRQVSLGRALVPDKVIADLHIDLREPFSYSGSPFRVPVRKPPALTESFFYPRGTIRSLDDDIFSPAMASLGMYEPAAFLEEAPMMFYALEEDTGFKVPVVFVHGINGSARDFASIVAKLDRRLYKPWFFYYPSGYDLGQLSDMFYSIFLSGKVIPLGDMPLVIVAHSMGGLVVRDALSRCTGKGGEAKTKLLITIASPMGGHPSAAAVAGAPVVIPSWRCLAPQSDFMLRLRRGALPDDLEYHLLYAFGNPSSVKLGENSDGVVPLSSQLNSDAQQEATAQYGFDDTHDGILHNEKAIRQVVDLVEEVRPPLPEDHLEVLVKGGYQVELGERYTPLEKHFIKTVGHYMDALASGAIAPAHPVEVQFVRACRGERAPGNEFERAWIKFSKDFPDRRALK